MSFENTFNYNVDVISPMISGLKCCSYNYSKLNIIEFCYRDTIPQNLSSCLSGPSPPDLLE